MKRLNIPFICRVLFLRGTLLINPPLIEHHHKEKSGESHTRSSKTNLHQCKRKKCFRVALYQVLSGGSRARHWSFVSALKRFGRLSQGIKRGEIGHLHVAIHVVQNCHAGEQKSHWDKTNKGNYHLKLCMSFVCLVPVRLLLSSMAVLYHVNG